ncbi:MAG: dihydropteroate synthase [Myxococcota bacterium]
MAYFASPKQRRSLESIQLGDAELRFDERFPIMGVVNVTPDSFSDGGEFYERPEAISHGIALAEAGADILDIGGESTRPGADPVPVDEELRRVIGVIEGLAAETDALISVDTYKASVAEAAVAAGAHIVNDISGLGFDDAMAHTVADTGAALVLMHTNASPQTMQSEIDYDDIIDDIRAYFAERLAVADEAGIQRERIILDPGIGFGKTVAQNYRIIREMAAFLDFGCPLLLGTSRKSLIGTVLDKPAEQRVFGTAATVACGLYAGADIVRVHDVAEIVDVVRVTEALAGLTYR